MATPIQTEQDAYRGDTLVLPADKPTIVYTTVNSQIRQTEDASAYFEAVSIVDNPDDDTKVDCTFSATDMSLLDGTKKYVMDVQFKNAAGFVVTTQKYALTITKDVTRVIGVKVESTTEVANEAARPLIGVAVVGVIYHALSENSLTVKAHADATDYSTYF